MTRPATDAPLTWNVSGLLGDDPGTSREYDVADVTIPLDEGLALARPIDGHVRLVRDAQLVDVAVRPEPVGGKELEERGQGLRGRGRAPSMEHLGRSAFGQGDRAHERLGPPSISSRFGDRRIDVLGLGLVGDLHHLLPVPG